MSTVSTHPGTIVLQVVLGLPGADGTHPPFVARDAMTPVISRNDKGEQAGGNRYRMRYVHFTEVLRTSIGVLQKWSSTVALNYYCRKMRDIRPTVPLPTFTSTYQFSRFTVREAKVGVHKLCSKAVAPLCEDANTHTGPDAPASIRGRSQKKERKTPLFFYHTRLYRTPVRCLRGVRGHGLLRHTKYIAA